MLKYPNIQIIARYYHLVFPLLLLFFMLNYTYFNFFDQSLYLIVVFTIVFGIFSITINIFQTVEYFKHLRKMSTGVYQYKRHRINMNSSAMAVFLLLYSIFINHEIKILMATVGIYLMLRIAADYILSKKWSTNILLIEGNNLINLNGEFKAIDLLKIKDYKESLDEIVLKNWSEKHTIRKKEFVSTDGLFEQIKEIINQK